MASVPLWTNVRQSFVVGPIGVHAATVRTTYTVPSGKRAKLLFAQIAIIEIAGAALGSCNYYLTINAVNILFGVNIGVAGYLHIELQAALDLLAGDIVTITTLNAAAIAHYYVGSIAVCEYK